MVGIKLEDDEVKFLGDFVKKGRKRANQSTHSATGEPAKGIFNREIKWYIARNS